jgi:hypothetical protein
LLPASLPRAASLQRRRLCDAKKKVNSFSRRREAVKKTVTLFALILLASTAAFAAGPAIFSGSDLWTTPGDGRTFADFGLEPIPAGFFCPGSASFTGQIAFHGVPLASDDPGSLGRTDTIVQRLDDAVFNKRGVAVTRLQVRALSLESIAPFKTSCGSFKAVVSLAGDQPVTSMRIVRDSATGGRFWAPLSLNVKLTFIPVGRNVQRGKLELVQSIRFDATPIAWMTLPSRPEVETKTLFVDTDGDNLPDAEVPSPSNFAAGARTKALAGADTLAKDPVYTEAELIAYHTRPTHAHLVTRMPVATE